VGCGRCTEPAGVARVSERLCGRARGGEVSDTEDADCARKCQRWRSIVAPGALCGCGWCLANPPGGRDGMRSRHRCGSDRAAGRRRRQRCSAPQPPSGPARCARAVAGGVRKRYIPAVVASRLEGAEGVAMRFRIPPEAGPTESVVECAQRDSGHERVAMRAWGR
jgi:hypothetical protein